MQNPMDVYLSPEHEALRGRVREFADAEIAPVARELDESSRFPWDNVRRMADMGLFGVSAPRELGGQGLDYLSYILVIEELARVDASHSITISAHSTLGTSPILAFGTEEQQRRYVPLLATGRVLGGFGLTEPGAGSDAGGTATVAVRENGGYRLSGSKIFITHAGVGEIFVVTAATDRSKGTKGITAFIVTKETTDRAEAERVGVGHAPELEPFTQGVRAAKKEDKMGWRASDTRELVLDNAFVPEENRLGAEGEGFIDFMKTLDAGRIGLGALALGLAQGAFEQALAFTSGREQFGRALRDFQGVAFPLADMATEIAAARHLVYHAAWLKQHGRPFTREAAMAKLYASELAMRATTRAIQLMGGYGYTSDYPVERMFRDAKICEIGEGTSEVQRLVVSRDIFRAYDRLAGRVIPDSESRIPDESGDGSSPTSVNRNPETGISESAPRSRKRTRA
ncbi:MAG TPA: acyl-CoA dehydrogenase family protein [Longimicrobiales bacterium]|nr:acyl-CoA dehydrogenase family protein [Longimicrobiales bacterium]